MKRAFVLATVLVAVAGCENKTASLPTEAVTSDAVHDDGLFRNFTKVWHYQVTPDVQLNVTTSLKPWLEKCDMTCGPNALSFSDELKQGDGKWVDFDCDKVADKIIVRDLVPKVEASCRAVHELATAYWKGNNDPSEFTDNSGRVWRRQ